MSRDCRVGCHGMGVVGVSYSAFDLGRRHNGLVCLWPSEAHGRSHFLPAMSSLAGEIMDLVHLTVVGVKVDRDEDGDGDGDDDRTWLRTSVGKDTTSTDTDSVQ